MNTSQHRKKMLSISHQTAYPGDLFLKVSVTWEWIVIDGFSEDGTINYLQKIKNKNVFFISEKDDGIFSAMNKGITASKGNYLYFLNSGDVLHENFSLEIILKNLIQ